MEKDGYTISWRLSNRSASSTAQVVTQEAELASLGETASAQTANDMRQLPNLSSVITYADALSGTDISYVVGPTGVRELITIESAMRLADDYTMEVTCEGLTPAVTGNEIRFLSNSEDEVFKIAAPFVMDAAGETTSEVALQLIPVAELQMLEEVQGSFQVQLQPSGGIMDEDENSESIADETSAPANEEGLNTSDAEAVPSAEEAEPSAEPMPESEETVFGEGLSSGETASAAVQLSGINTEGTDETAQEENNENETEASAEQPSETGNNSTDLAGTDGAEETVAPGETSGIWTEEGQETATPALSEARLQELQELQAQLEAGDAIDRISGMEAVDGAVTFTYTMLPSRSWLEAPERVFPITIDPDVEIPRETPYVWSLPHVDDTYVSSSAPSSNYYGEYDLKIGSNNSGGIYRTYLRYLNLPELNVSDIVISAKAYIMQGDVCASTGLTINLHRVTQEWTGYSLTWNNRPTYDETIESIAYPVAAGTYNSWDITRLTKDWYNGMPNYGFMLKLSDKA